jgi:hypothetical protein
MTAWTKADLRRMQAGLDLVDVRLNRGTRYDAPDEYREWVNASLTDQGLAIVQEHLRSLVSRGETSSRGAAEGRAAERLLDRLEIEPLPRELLTLPRLLLHREIEASLAAETENEKQRVAELTKPVDVPLYQPDLERDRRVIRTNLDDLVSRGVVEVHRATSEAFNTDTPWSDVIDLVSWVSFARPAAERRSALRGFDRCTTTDPWSLDASVAMTRLWTAACDEEKLPLVLDLRGALESHGHLVESWRDALAAALRRASRGIVIVVDGEAWALVRLLPQRVGSASD